MFQAWTVLNSILSCLEMAPITIVTVLSGHSVFYVGLYVLALQVDGFFSLSITALA